MRYKHRSYTNMVGLGINFCGERPFRLHVCFLFPFPTIIAEHLKMILLSCDGGQKDDKHKPESMLNPTAAGLPSSSSEWEKKIHTKYSLIY